MSEATSSIDQYLSVVRTNQDQDKAQLGELALLTEENKKQLMEALSFTSYLGDPITADFQREYILTDSEFGTEEAKLAQSVNELNGRTNNMLSEGYQFTKTQIEMARLLIDKDFKIGAINEETYKAQIKENDVQMLDLEIKNKQVNLRKMELAFNVRFQEAMHWKANIEKSLKLLGKTSIEQVDLTRVRPDNMLAKIKHWGVRHAEGSFEFTPSNLPIVEKHKEVFDQGVLEGLAKLQEINPGMFIHRCKALGVALGPVAQAAPKAVQN
jgi:hypothetical protein